MLYYSIKCTICEDVELLADSCDSPNAAFTEMGWRINPDYGYICPECLDGSPAGQWLKQKAEVITRYGKD